MPGRSACVQRRLRPRVLDFASAPRSSPLGRNIRSTNATMMTLKDPLATPHAIFLRDHSQSEFLHRLPPAPAVLLLPGAGSALHFTMYRYDLNDPSFTNDRGGGVVLITLDFGTLPIEGAEAQTQLPSTAPPQVSLPPVTAGKLHLW